MHGTYSGRTGTSLTGIVERGRATRDSETVVYATDLATSFSHPTHPQSSIYFAQVPNALGRAARIVLLASVRNDVLKDRAATISEHTRFERSGSIPSHENLIRDSP